MACDSKINLYVFVTLIVDIFNVIFIGCHFLNVI